MRARACAGGLFVGLIAAGYAALRALERRASRRDLELAARSRADAATGPAGISEESRRAAG
jgi:hypothetical protein